MRDSRNKRLPSRGGLLLFVRLILIFAFAFTIGYRSGEAFYCNGVAKVDLGGFSYFDSEGFISNLVKSSSLELFLFICMGISALTFFCPFAVHFLTAACGFSYGTRLSHLILSNGNDYVIIVYTLFSIIFALLLIRLATITANANKAFLNKTSGDSRSLISKEFLAYIVEFGKLFFIFTVSRTIYVILLSRQ